MKTEWVGGWWVLWDLKDCLHSLPEGLNLLILQYWISLASLDFTLMWMYSLGKLFSCIINVFILINSPLLAISRNTCLSPVSNAPEIQWFFKISFLKGVGSPLSWWSVRLTLFHMENAWRGVTWLFLVPLCFQNFNLFHQSLHAMLFTCLIN